MLNSEIEAKKKELELIETQKRNAKRNKVRDYCAKYVLSPSQLKKFQKIFLYELRKGLSKATRENADIKCHITYITDLPDGNEQGKFLVLDVLARNNFRVHLFNFIGERKFEMKSKVYVIPQNLMSDEGEKLFDCIVNGLTNFIDLHGLRNIILPMGFIFPFPINQLSLNKGLLVRWTKGFTCPGVVGKNVVKLLEEALMRKGTVNVHTVALLNDTTGTLMSCAYDDVNCRIAVIVGNGCNACYLENIAEVQHWTSSTPDATHVIVNCEFGALGENDCINFLRTNEDRDIDETSSNKGQQYFEKMVSGMYMGELVRLIILQLTKEKVLFNGYESDMLNTYGSFKTSFISNIESDPQGVYKNCKLILRRFRLDKHATDDDCENILYICQCISRRSAHLISAAISVLIDKINQPIVTVGADGFIYRLHPHYHKLMIEKIEELRNPQFPFNCTILPCNDGPGKGAAVVAAVANRKKT